MKKMNLFKRSRPQRTNHRGETTVVYALVDPRDSAVRYVGVTNSVLGRFKEHMRMNGGNERKNTWLHELLDAHMLPLMYTLEVLADESDWRDREIAWIQTYKELGADLLNDEIYRFEGVYVKETKKVEQPKQYVRLTELPHYKLGEEGEMNAFDASNSEFLQFAQSLVLLKDDDLGHWTWFERRDFLNWCLDEHVLTIKDGRLVPCDLEETISTQPLSNTENECFLADVEHARTIIHEQPDITNEQLAAAMGWSSLLYAHNVRVYALAIQPEEKGEKSDAIESE